MIADGYETNSAISLEMYCVMLAYVGMSASGLVFGKNSAIIIQLFGAPLAVYQLIDFVMGLKTTIWNSDFTPPL